ncbi:hypothetical protein D9M68_736730 [compost metagenome]
MAGEHALGVAGGARGVVEADVLPFVGGPFPARVGRLGGEPGFVLGIAQRAVFAREFAVFDAHCARRRIEQGQHFAHLYAVLAVEEQHGGSAMRQDVGQGGGVQPCVERIEDRASHGHAEMGLV